MVAVIWWEAKGNWSCVLIRLRVHDGPGMAETDARGSAPARELHRAGSSKDDQTTLALCQRSRTLLSNELPHAVQHAERGIEQVVEREDAA